MSEPSDKVTIREYAVWVTSLVGALLLLMTLSALSCFSLLPPLALAAFDLLLGWLLFLLRTAPLMVADWAGIGMAGACFTLLVFGIHAMGTISRNSHPESPRPWSWRRSLALSCGVVVLFLAGLAGVGLWRSLEAFATMDGPRIESNSPR